MIRRRLLEALACVPLLRTGGAAAAGSGQVAAASGTASRVRPGEPGWPGEAEWADLDRRTGGRLLRVRSPLADCVGAPSGSCTPLFEALKNPYYLGDEAGLTQTLGWQGAWTSRPSVYAVAARTTADVAAAVAFAWAHRLRLVVKGGGHSYHGASNAADSLLVWTRAMNGITLHDSFVGAGCAGRHDPVPAVTVEAGALWAQVYDAVTTRAGRYVQGGGCLTVGVAGLVQSGGFGSFSKRYGTAAAGLIEAEVVTADGQVRTANACTHPDLFWAIKGGGGGSFGVVTRLTLRTHGLPDMVGGVFATIEAATDDAFRRLIGRLAAFYAERLFNPHWGEQLVFRPGNVLMISMVFQDLDQAQADEIWRPFFDEVRDGGEIAFRSEPMIVALPARRFWDPAFLKDLPDIVLADDRPGAPEGNIFWAGNREEAGQILHAYQSTWLPASLLRPDQRDSLADTLFAASRHWSVSLHVNKGLAGAPPDAIAAARDTATNPAVLDAFALLICAAEGPPAYPGIAGYEPDPSVARRQKAAVEAAMSAIRAGLPTTGSYLAESDFFEARWQDAFWGANYPELLAVKDRYDPDGLFVVHHGVGSERWSADGFARAR
ncbi:FAD-binding oxidoreductase [Marinivivus vitaminiproducens]|nr:FAD-binding oxidoreductase [Geminicoccaceae bacterium SCSIO 64248]